MKSNRATAVVMLLATAFAYLSLVAPASADPISYWTAKADAVSIEQRASPRARARTLAMVNAAIFEAINDAVERDTTPHNPSIPADRNTSIEAAVAAAAHDVLVALYPDRTPELSTALAVSLSSVPNDVPKARGYALGKKIAAGILALWGSPGLALGRNEDIGPTR
jgi:hypothetical protein